MTTEKDLGTIVRSHRVDNSRRGKIALILIALGVVVTPVGALFLMLADRTSTIGDDMFPTAVLGGGLGCLLMGLWSAWVFKRRPNETFVVHVGGLVHSYATHSRAVPWREMTKVVNTGKDTGFARSVGSDVNCTITVVNGKQLHFSGLTEGADDLFRTVQNAVHHHLEPSP